MVNFNSPVDNNFPVINIKISEQNFNEESIVNEAISNLKAANIKGFDTSDKSWWKQYHEGKFYLYLAPDADNAETAEKNAKVVIVIDIKNVSDINESPASQNQDFIYKINEMKNKVFEGFSTASKSSEETSLFSSDDIDDFFGPQSPSLDSAPPASASAQYKPLSTPIRTEPSFHPSTPSTPSTPSEPSFFTTEETDAIFNDTGVVNTTDKNDSTPSQSKTSKSQESLRKKFSRLSLGKKTVITLGTILTAPFWVPVTLAYLLIKRIFR